MKGVFSKSDIYMNILEMPMDYFMMPNAFRTMRFTTSGSEQQANRFCVQTYISTIRQKRSQNNMQVITNDQTPIVASKTLIKSIQRDTLGKRSSTHPHGRDELIHPSRMDERHARIQHLFFSSRPLEHIHTPLSLRSSQIVLGHAESNNELMVGV